jgi:hypothetical protein
MDVDELASMDDEATRNLMFPPPLSRPSWRPWKSPIPKLPIDDFIASLIRTDNNHRKSGTMAIKSRSELESQPLPIVCPYYHARHAVWLAIGRGRMWADLVRYHRDELPERMAQRQKALELAESMEAFLSEGIDKRTLHPMPLYSDRHDPNDCTKRANHCFELERTMANALSLIRQHANQIDADCERIPVHGNTLQNTWKAGFAAQLGYCWTNLTGRLPSLSSSKTNKDFRSFVAAAFTSIGGNATEKWDRVLRQIIHNRPPTAEWDGYDRYEKDHLPPGTAFQTLEQWRASMPRRDGGTEALKTHPLSRLLRQQSTPAVAKSHPNDSE